MKIVRAIIFLAAGCWIWLAVAMAMTHFRQVYPTAENKSAFLKTYTPNTILDRFKSTDANAEELSEASDGADTGFATHMVSYEPTILIKSSDWAAVMQALHDDIGSRLTAQRTEIVDESGNAADGFKIGYALGKSRGTVTVDPIKTTDPFVQPVMRTAPGEVAIRLRIQIREKWFKAQDQASAQASRKRASL